MFDFQFSSAVVSCTPCKFKPLNGSKKVDGFKVVCEDTVIFPEGGGQVRNIVVKTLFLGFIKPR